MTPKVSVIVPIYNVEKYIERCVRSLMEQTLQEIEYIFINDCTPDSSINILKTTLNDYTEKKNQIIILNHDVNKGLASTRNTGLEVASGEFVIYCDSDDWVEKDMYETMYNKAIETNADIIVVDYVYEYPTHSVIKAQPYPNDSLECVRKMLAGELHCGTCNKLIKRELYLKNHISFPDGINMWEDVLTTIPLCYFSSKIVYLNKAFYHYVQFNANSYTQCISERSLQNMIEAVTRLESFFRTNHIDNLNKEFCFTKLTVKLNLLIGANKEKQVEWNKLYKETYPYILSYKAMSLYWRIALKFASWNMLPIFNIMAYASKYLKLLSQ